MAHTIGNPLSWTAQRLAQAGHHAAESTERLSPHENIEDLHIARLQWHDLTAALREGLHDFAENRSDVIFICLVYPVIGIALGIVGLQMNQLPLLFPLLAGFALVGPLAAVFLYEISRRREQGLPADWYSALSLMASPRFPAVVVLGLYHIALFIAWMFTAETLHAVFMGPELPQSLGGFLYEVLFTGPGQQMMVAGFLTGGVFALLVLVSSAVSYPALIDRDIGLVGSVVLSLRVFRRNPGILCLWGLIVAVSLALGALPALIGLVVVLPVLGHATWHLYRRAVW